jgi:hypothetical protein
MCMDGKLLHKLRTTIKLIAEHYEHCCAILDVANSEVNVSVLLCQRTAADRNLTN